MWEALQLQVNLQLDSERVCACFALNRPLLQINRLGSQGKFLVQLFYETKRYRLLFLTVNRNITAGKQVILTYL